MCENQPLGYPVENYPCFESFQGDRGCLLQGFQLKIIAQKINLMTFDARRCPFLESAQPLE